MTTCLACASIAECMEASRVDPDELARHKCLSWSKAPPHVLAARQDTLALGRLGVLALLETSTTHLTGDETAMSNEKYDARKEELENKHRPALKRELNALLKPLKGKHLQAALQTFKPEEDWSSDDDDARKRANALALRTPQEEMVEVLLAIEFPAQSTGDEVEEEEEEVEEKPKPKKRGSRSKKASPKEEAPAPSGDDSEAVGLLVKLGKVLDEHADFLEEERKARIEFEQRVGFALVAVGNDVSQDNGYGTFDELVDFGKELCGEEG